jgi:hypothetical protein
MDRNLAPFEGGSGTSMGVAGGAKRVEGEPCFSRSAAAVSSVASATTKVSLPPSAARAGASVHAHNQSVGSMRPRVCTSAVGSLEA